MSRVEKCCVCIKVIKSVHVESISLVSAVYFRIGFKFSGVQFQLRNKENNLTICECSLRYLCMHCNQVRTHTCFSVEVVPHLFYGYGHEATL